MLEWLGDKFQDSLLFVEAAKIENAIINLLKQNQKTIDIGGNLSTSEFTKRLVNLL